MKLFTKVLLCSLSFVILFTSTAFTADYYWVGGAGNWSELSHWATTSGGSTFHTSLPGETDDVFFDANSFSADGQTVNVDRSLVRMHDFIAQAVSYNVTISGETSFPDFEIYGSMNIPANVTLEWPGVLLDFNADALGQTVNIANGTLNTSDDASIRFSGEGSWTLQSTINASSLFVTQGEIIFGANEFNFDNVYLWYSFNKTLNLTDATLNIEKWQISSQESYVTIIPDNSTINFSDEFQGKGKTYGTVNVVTPTGFANDVEITGSNTFQNFNVTKDVNLLVESGTTQTILGNLNFNGIASAPITFEASTVGEKFFFDGVGINISGDYVNISESDFLGTATFALENSILIGDVTGWEINSVPKPTDNGSFYYSKIYSDSLYIQLEAGDGAERIVFIREGTFPEVTVADDVAYTADQTFGVGASVGTDTYVIYQGSDDLVKIDGLNPNTTYYISLLDVNRTPDNSSIKYVATSTSFSKSTTTVSAGNVYLSFNGVTVVNGGEEFYDDGGTGFYFPNKEQVLTLNSAEAGKSIELTFNEFETRSYEELRIFDGADTTASLLTTLSGTGLSLPITVSSTGENLTLKFISTDFEPYAFDLDGWQADIALIFAAPTVGSSNRIINSFTDTSINFGFTKGNGDGRLIVAKEGNSSIQFNPAENTTYTASTSFGSGQDLGNGEFVVAFSDVNSLNINNLPSKSEYKIKIWEYNKSGSLTAFRTTGYQFNVNNTESVPEDITDIFTVQFRDPDYIKNDRIDINMNYGLSSGQYPNDRKVLVLASESPVDNTNLTDVLVDDFRVNANNEFGAGDEVLPGVFAVNKHSSGYFELVGLSPNTQYYLYVIYLRENGAGTRYGFNNIGYQTYTTKEINSIFLGEANTLIDTVKVLYNTTGFGKVEVESLVKTFYPGNAGEKLTFLATLINLGSADKFPLIIYDGLNKSAPVLADYSGVGSSNGQIYAPLRATNPSGALTIEYGYKSGPYGYNGQPIGFRALLFDYKVGLASPTNQVKNIKLSNLTQTSVTLNWDRGNGENILVTLTQKGFREEKVVNGLDYLVETTGMRKISDGNYIVYKGNSNSVDLSELISGTEYTLNFYEYNGNGHEITYGTPLRYSFTSASNRPTIAATNLNFDAIDTETIKLSWDNGNGARRLIVARTYDYGYDKKDFDGNDFLANPDFESGRTYFDSKFNKFKVLYNGTGNTVNVTGLTDEYDYDFRVLEYNGENNTANYLTSEVGSFSFLPALPLGNVNDAEAFDITTTTAKLKWTRPSGTYDGNYTIAFISTDPDAVLALEDGFYEEFTISNSKQSNGYIVKSTSGYNNDASLYNLSANTTYYVSIYTANYFRRSLALTLNRQNVPQISFTTNPTQNFYWVGGDGNWNNPAHWAKSTGGTDLYDTIPTSDSKVYIDQNSFSDSDNGVINILNSATIYSLNAKDLIKTISFNNRDSSGYLQYSRITVLNDFTLTDSVKGNLPYFYFEGVEKQNRISLPKDFNVGLNFKQPNLNNEFLIDSLPNQLDYFISNNSKITFSESSDSLQLRIWRDSNTEMVNPPTILKTSELKSGQSFSKVYFEYEGYSYFDISGSPTIDSLFLGGSDLRIDPLTQLTVNSIDNQGEDFLIYSRVRGQEGYIKTNRDSLVIEHVEIYDNHAIGNGKFIAKNSILYDNVLGWETDSAKVPSTPPNPRNVYLDYGDSTRIVVRWRDLELGNPLLMIWEEHEEYEIPIQNNFYKYVNDLAQADTIGNAKAINLKGLKSLELTGLKPNTQYFLRLYSYNQYDTLVNYSNGGESIEFRTSTGRDVFFGDSYEDQVIAKGQTLYSAQGIGYSFYSNNQYDDQALTILPSEDNKKVAIKIATSEYYGAYLSLFSPVTEDRIARFSLFSDLKDTTLISESIGEGFKASIYKSGSSSRYPNALKFNIQSVYGELSVVPSTIIENFEVSDVTDSTLNLTWESNPNERVLIVAKKGSSVAFEPVNYFQYTGNSSFGNSNEAFNENEFIVFAGIGNELTVSNLEQNSTYTFMAYTYSQSEGKDPHYKTDTAASVSQQTLIKVPTSDIASFEFTEIESNRIAFQLNDFEAEGSIVVASKTKDFDFEPGDTLVFNSFNSYKGFNEAPEIIEGVRLLYAGNYDEVNYQANDYTENTIYYIKVFAFNGGRENKRFQKSNIAYDSVKTMNASFEIISLSDDLICVNSILSLNYEYLGVDFQGQAIKVIVSAEEDMSAAVELEILDNTNFVAEVLLSEEVAVGDYYIAVVPETGNFNIFSKPLTVSESTTPEIFQEESYLISSEEDNTSWYRNTELISNSMNTDSLEFDKEGLYYQVKRFANCEYVSNEIYVRAEVGFSSDTITTCYNALIQVPYEMQFGQINPSFTYEGSLVSTENTFDLEDIVLDSANHMISANLPEDMLGGTFELYFSSVGDSVIFTTPKIIVVENPSEAIITIENDQLKSNYEAGNQWYFNGEAITGATGPSIFITKRGDYSLEVTVGNCVLSASLDNVLANKNSFDAIGLVAYPNPTKDYFHISYNGAQLEVSQLIILDSKGTQLAAHQINFKHEKELVLSVKDYAAGMYFIILQSGQVKAISRFIKK